MYLKRIEITGFKSFADNIKLQFEPGITSVVGPNGCGKSNIIDAIRWCLGEMSAKSLRSNLMLDVVFNGSGSRPPQNLAEVVLIFDNSDKRLPIDYSEVSVGRKLFRSGESEYYLNKTQCRLRDIRELFLDTGMGEDGYSFMAQGKVEWILSAKPEERRELFEEAAGVSKYRARREESMRKLDRVEIDLSRLADIISVTQDQVRKLENAVNRARNYQKVKDQLKNLEIGDWLFELEHGDQNLQAISTRLEEAQKKAENLNTKIHKDETEIAQFRLTYAEAEEKLLDANGKLNEVESNIKINEERKSNSIQREEELTNQSTTITNNIHREKGRIQEISEQQKLQEQNLVSISDEGKNIEPDYSKAKEAHEESLKKLEEKTAQTKELRNNILQRTQQRNQLQTQMAQLTSESSKLESELESRQKEMSRLEVQIDELTQQTATIQEQFESFKSQLDSKAQEEEKLGSELKLLKEKEINQQKELMTQSEAIAGLKGQIESIKGQQSQDPYLAGTQAILSQNFPGIHGPINRLVRCMDSERDLVTTTLGEHLLDLVTDSQDIAEQAVRFLESQNKGRARIWILDKIPGDAYTGSSSDESKSSLIDMIQCDSKFKPLLAHIFDFTWHQDNIVHGNGFLNGGVDPSKWKSHGLMRSDEIEKSLEEKEAQRAYTEQGLQAIQIEKTDMATKRESTFKEMEECRVRLQVTEEENSKLSERLKLLNEELTLVKTEIEQGKSDRTKAKEALENCVNEGKQIEEKEKEEHANLDILQHELTDLQEAHAQFSAELSAKQERHNSFQQKLNWQSNIVDQIKSDLENVNVNITHYEDTLKQNAIDIEAAKKAQEESTQNIATFLEDRQKAAAVCTEIQNQRTELTTKINELDQSLTQLRKAHEEVQEIAHNEGINQTSLKGRLESIHQKLSDQYEMTLDQAKADFKPEQADVELLDKLKKRVSNMGPINLAAPEEHKELLEKSEFLTTQQADLLKAKQDLRDVIAKINATTREHFRETFQKVRENFRRLYSTLFQGGEADLHFTNEADILSTGIDIFCQPPGKKLLHISLMSGGEKALTAVALLFAFFQVRPSPLALLDEVDAPLDEANVTRFVQMVKDFSQNSQFILITHNKRTMEAAHSLYGVTMEELGVSKVISTRLVKESKAHEKTAATEETTPA